MISYAYLWADEHRRGQEEGLKNRPCTVVLARQNLLGKTVVTVLPVTHTPPPDPGDAVEIPSDIKARLGLDDQRSWIVLTETNDFLWPGPDLRPAAPGRPVYGVLPPGFFRTVRDRLMKAHARRVLARIPRTE